MKRKKMLCFLYFNILGFKTFCFFNDDIELKKQGFKVIEYEKETLNGEILISSEKINKDYNLDVEAIYDLKSSQLLVTEYSNYDELLKKKEIVLFYKENKVNKFIVKELKEKKNGI